MRFTSSAVPSSPKSEDTQSRAHHCEHEAGFFSKLWAKPTCQSRWQLKAWNHIGWSLDDHPYQELVKNEATADHDSWSNVCPVGRNVFVAENSAAMWNIKWGPWVKGQVSKSGCAVTNPQRHSKEHIRGDGSHVSHAQLVELIPQCPSLTRHQLASTSINWLECNPIEVAIDILWP